MIKELTWEICKCLKDGYYMAALISALTIPDICGKAEFPNLEKNKKRYVDWFDKYIGNHEKERQGEKGMPYLSGELVYSLRCSLLHQGNPNIQEHISDKNNIIYFELRYQRLDGASRRMGAAEAQLIRIDGEEKAVNIKYCIDVKLLCYKLCIAARDYYKKNKEKFDFFNYKIVGLDFNTKRNLGVSINETAFDYKNDNEELDIDIIYQMACEF